MLAYGYGKNHGWTRIVRVVHSIIPHAFALLSQSSGNYSSKLLSLQIKQLMRWNCRLSHVAAHTRMLTIFTDDLIKSPVFQLDQIMSFVKNIKFSNRDLYTTQDQFKNNFIKDLNGYDGNINKFIDKLTISQRQDIIETIKNELKDSQRQMKWPCLFFRPLEQETKDMSEKLIMSANMLSANCSSSFVTCSVPHDKNGG